jgi:hypothetical protein
MHPIITGARSLFLESLKSATEGETPDRLPQVTRLDKLMR